MSELLSVLQSLGCETQQTSQRFLGDEKLLGECVKMVLCDEEFYRLGKELERENAQKAFEYAHSLKGVVSNVGLTPLLELIIPIVETLRKGSCEGLNEKYQRLIEKKNQISLVLEKNEK